MLRIRRRAFADPNEALLYNTSVVATIRTVNEEPIYAKLYPYPMGAADFVNNEIQDLLRNGIIQKSVSPYNNPIWVVDKKGTDENVRKKMRLVIDFRKLNERTVSDKYPTPNISMILGNLSKAKYFSTLDLNHHTQRTLPDTHNRDDETALELLPKPNNPSKRSFFLFGNKRRHAINFSCVELLLDELADVVVPKGVNAILCDLHTLAMVQNELVLQFPATKFWH
ncbi:hypothetical protein KR093_005908 [Drosophila rubida]|uniref:Uncharacterized protein n=1 Tax=Drosophila rubida TaxID=30044 RepID=A0AAD4JX82_9MUSC|nr:hypothetical protein KR093_005908 [Drosophila rubida]